MSTTKVSISGNVVSHAERELAAFLAAVTEVVGPTGLGAASNVWIQTMQELDCSQESLGKFFRQVTIRASARLARNCQRETRFALAGGERMQHLPLTAKAVERFLATESA
ncbi:hypothetical protein ACPOL_1034 [Acidisarcina polymorpha]|uniref:Uncharacterized protein n=1 Tax=Acidisarcina polymorpha TaxID=2211140 RepID=A0A2Z5FVJ6_9BACT|nr:hypothetical protein [Acidisarcina polymorpha]AXC10385.1 hypothetical protein ACPOL_1034 [Acidisarcina polymorpha]